MSSNTPYVAHVDYAQPNDVFTTDSPKISQTPCEALGHKHHIIASIITIIITFWINYGIARLVLSSADRVGLFKTHDYVIENGVKYMYAGSPIMVDLIITILLCGFFCALTSHGGVGGAVQRGEAIPIPKSVRAQNHRWDRYIWLITMY